MARKESATETLTTSTIASSDVVYDLYCDLCADFDTRLQAKAKGYCVERRKYLCSDCIKSHLMQSPSRNHVITINDKMPHQKPSPPLSMLTTGSSNDAPPTVMPVTSTATISAPTTVRPVTSTATISAPPNVIPATSTATISAPPTVRPVTSTATTSSPPTVMPATPTATTSATPTVISVTSTATTSAQPTVMSATPTTTTSAPTTVRPVTSTATISAPPNVIPATSTATTSAPPTVRPVTSTATISATPTVMPVTPTATTSATPTVISVTSTATTSAQPTVMSATPTATTSAPPTVMPVTPTATTSAPPTVMPVTPTATTSAPPTVMPATSTATISAPPTVRPVTSTATTSAPPTVMPATSTATISAPPTVRPVTSTATISAPPNVIPVTLTATISAPPTVIPVTSTATTSAPPTVNPATSTATKFAPPTASTDLMAEKVKDINVRTKTDREDCWITGCVMLPGGRMILADHCNDKIKLLDLLTSTVTSELSAADPWNVASIVEYQVYVVVTLVEDGEIMFVKVEESDLKAERKIKVGGKCKAVVHRGGKLIVSFCDPVKIEIMGLDGKLEKKIDCSRMFRWPSHMALIPGYNAVYVSDRDGECVKRVNLEEGSIEAQYEDEELDCPRGVILDQQGRVIVCGEDSFNIHLLTTDLRKIKLLAGGLRCPSSLLLCHANGRLYVGREGDNMSVYKLYKLS